MKRFFALASVVIFLGAVLLFVPFFGFAMNPQPEPPAQIKSGYCRGRVLSGNDHQDRGQQDYGQKRKGRGKGHHVKHHRPENRQ